MLALGKYVRARRSTRGLTIQQACSKAGISDTKWTQVEHGKGPHSKATLKKVAWALSESPRHLFDMADITYEPTEVEDVAVITDEVASLRVELAEAKRQIADLASEVASRLPPE